MTLPRHDRLRLRHLRLFELIDRHGSLRAVAEELGMSQPAVSQMLRDLEDAFGVRLVERSARGVALNPAGRRALSRARPSLAFVGRLAEELATRVEPPLRVGANPALMFKLMPRALRLLEREGAGRRFSFQTGVVGSMTRALIAGDLDCYVGRVDWERMPPDAPETLSATPLAEIPIVIACAADHPLAARARVTAADTLDHRWVLPPPTSSNRAELEARFRDLGLTPPEPAVESVLPGLLAIAAETRCLTCTPLSALQPGTRGDALAVLEVEDLRLRPARIGIVSLEPPEEGGALRDLVRALHAAHREIAAD